MKKKIGIVLFIILFIAALVMGLTKGFALDVNYDNHINVKLNLGKEYEIYEIEDIAKEVFNNKAIAKDVGAFDNTVQVSVKNISEEQKEQFKQKICEKYQIEQENLQIEFLNIPNINIIDIFDKSIVTIIVSIIIIGIYMAIKNKKVKEFIKIIINVVVIQTLFLSIVMVTRIPVNMYIYPICLVIIVLTIFFSKDELKKAN